MRMTNTTRTRSLLFSRVAAAALATGLAATLAVPATASASTTPVSPQAGNSAPEAAVSSSAREVKDLVNNTSHHDGVKGTIKNFTPHTLRVLDTQAGLYGEFVLIKPGEQVTFYNCREFDWREGRDIVIGGRGASFSITRADGGGASRAHMILADPFVGRPDTYFGAYPIKNLRYGWSEGDSHHENTPDSSFWIKREKDGWNGGHESRYTSDWAVFTVHVDKI